MKHFFFVWFVFMAALASFAADAPAAKTLEGSWVPVKAELGGQPVPEAVLKTISPGEVTLEFFVKDTVVSVFKSGMKRALLAERAGSKQAVRMSADLRSRLTVLEIAKATAMGEYAKSVRI